jgi:hypothetical protein
MATFPRTRLPERVGLPWLPGAIKQRSQAGLLQIRNTKQVGWTWTEEWNLLSVRNADDMALIAFVTKMWNRGEIHDFTHPLLPGSGVARNGTGTGTPVVNGASQTGDTLNVNGWGASQSNVMRAGDVFTIGTTDKAVYMVGADANSDGAGAATLQISPALRVSPANGAALTISGVTFRATCLNRSQFEGSEAPQYYGGLTLTITEALP